MELTDIEQVGSAIERLVLHGHLNPSVNRIDKDFYQKVKSIDVVSKLNAQVFGKNLEDRYTFKLGYEPKTQRISIRNGDTRIILQ